MTNHSLTRAAEAMPPHAWFGVSAIFHYLGPSFAVLLFPSVGVLGVAWLRVASASLIFTAWNNPWKTFRDADQSSKWLIIGMGLCLAVMNTCFYLALERIPMSLVAAMEFVGTICVALYGLRSSRNLFALILTVIGVLILINVKWSTDPIGLFWATLNGAFFVGYIILGHKISQKGAGTGIELLGCSMTFAFLFLMPIGFVEAINAFSAIKLVLGGVAVGICSSVIPYICDQMAMSRLSRKSFALLLALLPAMATLIAAIILSQIPSVNDLIGISLVMVGIAFHKS